MSIQISEVALKLKALVSTTLSIFIDWGGSLSCHHFRQIGGKKVF